MAAVFLTTNFLDRPQLHGKWAWLLGKNMTCKLRIVIGHYKLKAIYVHVYMSQNHLKYDEWYILLLTQNMENKRKNILKSSEEESFVSDIILIIYQHIRPEQNYTYMIIDKYRLINNDDDDDDYDDDDNENNNNNNNKIIAK